MSPSLPRQSITASFVLAFVVGVSAAAPARAQVPDHAAERTLRVVTYNIAGARYGSLAELAAVIGAMKPDVVALQEVASNWAEDTGFDDQAAVLGELLGMEAFYAPIYSIPDEAGGPREFGLAILTSLPVTRTVNHRLTRHSTQAEGAEPGPMPGFPEVSVLVDGVEVRVFNTHLDYRRDPTVRQSQIAEMLGLMGPLDRPTLLVGDLNAPPEAPELAPLFERLHDAWQGQEEPGYTGPTANPRHRIDYVLFSHDCSVRGASVVDADASDHRPVVADLTCTPR